MQKFKLNMIGWQVENSEQFKKQWWVIIPKLKDWTYTVEINKYNKDRSLNQNKYYWFVISLFADEIWVWVQDLHEEMKFCFLRSIHYWIEWSEFYTIRSTKDLNTKQFEEYLEGIRRKAQEEYNLMIPLPHDNLLVQCDYI